MFVWCKWLALPVAVLSALALAPAQASAQTGNVEGIVTNRAGHAIGTFAGTFAVERFEQDANGDIVAVGNLKGRLINRGGHGHKTVDETVSVVVEALGVEHSDGSGLEQAQVAALDVCAI